MEPYDVGHGSMRQKSESLEEELEPAEPRLVSTALQQYGYPALALAGLLVFWQVADAVFNIPNYILPSPWEIGTRIVAERELLLGHTWATTWEVLLGFLLSVVIGIPLAIGIVYSPIFEKVAYSLLVSSQTIPKVALAPLFLIWFGFGIMSKVVVSFLIAFFPIVIDTVVGMRSVEPEMLHLARSLGARPLQVFAKFRFPKALPNIFGGLKVGITLAVVGAIVGEFIGANAGLGYLQLQANSNLDTTLLFSTIVVLSAMGIALFAVISALERVVIRWRPPEELEATHATM